MRHFSVGTSIGGQVLPQVSTHRHLGLILHECLSWSPHIQSVVTKVSQRLGLLFRLRNQLPALVTRELYVTCIHLEYSSIVWSGLSQTDSSRLERLNRRAARLITRCSRLCDLPHSVLLARAGLQELSQRRRLGQALFTFRFANVNLPAHILDGLALAPRLSLSTSLPASPRENAPASSCTQKHSETLPGPCTLLSLYGILFLLLSCLLLLFNP